MEDVAWVQCPYCFEIVEVYVDPDSTGEMVQDCDVCCRPWQLAVHRGDEGELHVTATRTA